MLFPRSCVRRLSFCARTPSVSNLSGWLPRNFARSVSASRNPSSSWRTASRYDDAFDAVSDGQEDAVRAAILEKAMKGRQPTDLMLRCTILDSEGKIKTISGQFKKSDLCAEHQLNPRDLRKIDSRVPNVIPTILARHEAILVNILHIRALVKSDTVLLFDTYGSIDTRLHSVFLYHLEHNLKMKGINTPYEFRALESILLSVLSAQEAELVFNKDLIGGLLAELDDDIDRDKFKRLLYSSRRLTSFHNRVKLVHQALEEVLEQDEDLAAMYLTDKRNGVERTMKDHEELEILLESFSKQVEEIVNETETLASNVQSTQEIVELILDSNRNALLALDLKVSIGTMGLGMGTLVAGLFGMNLTSHLEETSWAFFAVSGIAVVTTSVMSIMGLRRLAKIRRVGLAVNHQHRQHHRRPRGLERWKHALWMRGNWMPLFLRRRRFDEFTS